MTLQMRRRALAWRMAALAVGISSLGGCTLRATLGDAGAGPQVEQDRAVEPFSALALHGGIDATVNVGTPQRVTVAGRLQTLNDAEIYVEQDVLHVRAPKTGKHDDKLKLTITAPTLEAIATTGASKLEVAGLRGDAFALAASGATHARLRGEVDALTAMLEGASELDSTELLAQSVQIALKGTGQADITALAELNAAVDGTGRVRYRGEPTVAKAVHGLGRVRPM